MTLKKKITISTVSFSILATLLIAFVIFPLLLEIKKNSQEFISQKEKLAILERKAENVAKFKTIFPAISADLEKISHAFVDPKVPVDFINFLENTSQDYNLSLKISLSQSVTAENDIWPSLLFQLNLVGSFLNFSKFLEKLESSPYLIVFQNITINRLSGANLKPEIEIKNLKESEQLKQPTSTEVEVNLSIKAYTK